MLASFGGEKRFEHARGDLVGNARAVIRNDQMNQLTPVLCAHLYSCVINGLERLPGVQEEIQQGMLYVLLDSTDWPE